ncbi:MAG: tRNA (N6-threonylcarbamoyladenosine(37)-N6)-methyltransferase TrmO [Oscillospiraceae bacterium]|nr:tRNA (N6-threonylcarbamoyladenosine(37)-N6)-methyltransferase TrmO [Oscillospiraceae bacterium]
MESFERTIEPVAYIHTDFKEKFGIPRQSGLVDELTAKIVFCPAYRNPEALRGLSEFSHIWLLFDFSKAHRKEWSPTVRPPRLGGNERIGVFASRSPFRPNSIGLSCVKLEKIERTENEGDVLIVRGADLLDMTPIYDIKPYIPYADCHPEANGGFTDMRKRIKLSVSWKEGIDKNIPEDKRLVIEGCISEDPRPSYQEDNERVYSMRFAEFDIHFTVKGTNAEIVGADVIKN